MLCIFSSADSQSSRLGLASIVAVQPMVFGSSQVREAGFDLWPLPLESRGCLNDHRSHLHSSDAFDHSEDG